MKVTQENVEDCEAYMLYEGDLNSYYTAACYVLIEDYEALEKANKIARALEKAGYHCHKPIKQFVEENISDDDKIVVNNKYTYYHPDKANLKIGQLVWLPGVGKHTAWRGVVTALSSDYEGDIKWVIRTV